MTVEDRKDHPAEEAQQGRLHPGEGLETHLLTLDSGEVTGGGRRRADIVRRGNLRAAAS